MDRPPESLKSFCNRLAQTAITRDGQSVLQQLRAIGVLGPAESRPAQPAAAGRNDRVGIWERKKDGDRTYFVRSADSVTEWRLWARMGRIGPKLSKKRVVLIGESVARGYLYDPQFTLAMSLESMLQAEFGKNDVEVIDLARTGLALEVRELAASSLLLEPDAVVIFSGNNWNVVSKTDPLVASEVLREQGVSGLKRLAESELAEQSRRLVAEIAAECRKKGVPLVWIVPEFNLDDWREPEGNVPHLVGGANQRWIILRGAAQQALKEDETDGTRATGFADEMIALDEGLSPAGFYIRAECSRRAGDLESARASLEQARDAAIWDRSVQPCPRAYAVVQNAIRTQAEIENNAIVDLPRIFREHLGGGLPDHTLFLDYCHLTVEGIQVSMAAAASRIVKLLKKKDVPAAELVKRSVGPSARVRAEAEFLAAVHNAHHHQSYRVSRLHSAEALRLDPEIAPLLLHYMEIQARRTPMLMSSSAEQIARLGSDAIKHYLFNTITQQVDPVLIDALADSLMEAGTDARSRLNRIWSEEHKLSEAKQDLLGYYYSWGAHQPRELAWAMPEDLIGRQFRLSHFYKAYWPESKFVFIGQEGQPVQLDFTGRLPEISPPQAMAYITINRKKIGQMSLDREWSSWEISVPEKIVREGVNELVFHWPMPEFPGQAALQEITDPTDLFAIFGEIHSLTVSEGRPAAAGSEKKQASLLSAI